MIEWDRKCWFVTGASAGFGRAFVEAVLMGGGRVIATARQLASLDYLAGHDEDRVLRLALDVTDAGQIASAMAASAAFGGFDVLVNNAGYGFLGGVEESLDEEIAAQFAVNFFGPLNLIRAALPMLRGRGEAYIVNISSIAGFMSFPGGAFYAASKFALEGLSEGLAAEVASFGIRVMLVEPGFFRTEFQGRSIGLTAGAHPAYPELAERRAAVQDGDGHQRGDPKRGVAAIIKGMSTENPPLRLPLGPDGHDMAVASYERRREQALQWKALSIDTDFIV